MIKLNKLNKYKLIFMFLLNLICGSILLSDPILFLRISSGILFALIFPGYFFLLLIFPDNDHDHFLWRLCLTLPTSVALISIILLGLNYFLTYKIQYVVVFLISQNSIIFIVLFMTHIYRQIPFNLKEFFKNFRVFPKDSWFFGNQKFPNILLSISILFMIGAFIFAIIIPKQSINITEFYILSPSRAITGPIVVNNEFIYGIINNEGREHFYNVIVYAKKLVDLEEVWTESVVVKNGDSVERKVLLPSITPDVQEFHIFLFKKDENQPYRKLIISIKD